ncbi:MAG: PD40 domain-containing protein [Bacteroidetes bacterium]|nr:PD40 domain-containing protein [Bacteroidota bacterium]
MRFFFTYIILLFFLSALTFGQEPFDPERTFYNAEFEYNNGNFRKTAQYYESLLKKGTKTAHIKYKLARTYLEIPGKESNAVFLLEDAVKTITPDFKTQKFAETKAPYEALLLLGEAYQMNDLLAKATEKYKKYKSHIIASGKNPETVNRKLNSISTALKLRNTPLDVDKTFLPFYEFGIRNYNPVFSGDGNRMAFMSDGKYYKAIYFSEKQNGKWFEPRNITMELESDGSFLITSLSHDGNVLYLTKKINNNDYDLFYSRFNEGKWLKITSLDQINTMRDEIHASESPDGRFLVFSSNRGSSIGGYDLYISASANGNWENPENLGPVINTPYNESTPFYSPDGKKLYFSSEGHNTMGRYDIFMSGITNDNRFSPPQNLGYPVNTTKDDIFYCPSEKDFIGYTANVFDKTQELNVIRIEQFNAFHPRKVIIKGTIITDKTKEIIIHTLLKSIPIETTLKQEVFKLSCIQFLFDDWGLSKTSTRRLDQVYKILIRVDSAKLRIVGHTDAIGSNKYNISLSQKRAVSVQNYLIKKGISPKRLNIRWEGETHPVAINKNPDGADNPEGRKFNRRVCFDPLNIPENITIEYINQVPEGLNIK